jgi:hypothetical protein
MTQKSFLTSYRFWLSSLLLLAYFNFNAQTLSVCDGSVGLAANYPTNMANAFAHRLSPNGYFDKMGDRFGNTYLLSDLLTPEGAANLPGASLKAVPSVSCQGGFIKLFFAPNSGMDLATPQHAARRAVVCQVALDLSNMINPAFATSGSSVTVNILVDDPALYSTNPGLLGAASAYYAYPTLPSSTTPGLITNMVHKTIVSQIDAYTNLAVPVTPNGGGGFYHGFMFFNFQNPGVNWHTNMSVATASTDYDLYGVVLHELTHTLGFASLIAGTGGSWFGPNNNYYERYDKFLQTQANQPLIVSSNTCTSQYSMGFNPAVNPNVVGLNCMVNTNNTPCGTAVKYVSGSLPNMPVHTQNCYIQGSSLSHFEDQCYPLGAGYGNDVYFVMSDAQFVGSTKRYLREEERAALCDIGYPVGSTYSSPVFSANITYTGACNTVVVYGINDGINGNVFTYLSSTSTLTIPITGGGGVMANDSPNTSTISCVESVYANGTVAVVGNNIVFTAITPTTTGAVLLRYIPKNAAGVEGNITYIYMRISTRLTAL